MLIDEGYIKYNCKWNKDQPLPKEKFEELNFYRKELHKMKLIGAYPDSGIGFGNISVRDGAGFLISGTATGHLENLDGRHYSTVTGYDFKANSLYCRGAIKASSEGLTHAMLYEIGGASCNSVIHIHDLRLWKRLLYLIPTTGMNVSYGTPEMAMEVKRLFIENSLSKKKIMAMAGHYEGIIAFGYSIQDAFEILLDITRK